MGSKTIIIGGGVAGLSAGIYGRLNGYETEIIEMHGAPGGQCTSWRREGYTFDYCIHWLVGSSHGPFHTIWKETGVLDETVAVIDPVTYGTIRTAEGDLVIYTDINRWEESLIKKSPGDETPVRKLCDDLRKVATLKMIDKYPADRTILDNLGFLLSNIRILSVFAKHGRESVSSYFEQLGFTDDLLKKEFEAFADTMKGFSSLALLMTLAWFSNKNAGYPLGGSLPLTMRMMDRYRSLGGKFRGGVRVEKILTEGNKAIGVKLADGTEIFADIIIGAADLQTMIHGMLDGKFTTPELEKAFNSWPTFSPIVQVSFGIDCPIECNDHTYKVVRKGDQIGSTQLTSGFGVTNYNHDPLITPEGKCVMKLTFDSPLELWAGMDAKEYGLEKARIRADAISRLEEMFPGVKGHVDVADVATPLTNIRYTGVWKGSYEGFLPGVQNIGKSIKQTIRGLENFYLAGQWLHPGGGLPPSAQSGKWVFQLICRRDKKKFKVD